jgi:hypothetical protein
MLFELKLGTLIRRLNPYTGGGLGTMLSGPSPPVISPALAAAVNTAAPTMVTYANTPNAVNLQAAEAQEAAVDGALYPIDDIEVELDQDYRQEYMNWTFRGRPYAVKKALLIAYRYELMDGNQNPTGVFATEHVLVGYAGGNGG